MPLLAGRVDIQALGPCPQDPWLLTSLVQDGVPSDSHVEVLTTVSQNVTALGVWPFTKVSQLQ